MDWSMILQTLFTVVLIPLLGLITKYLVQFLATKIGAVQAATDNDTFDKYLGLLQDTVTDCVVATNQTYVNALKDKNAFDAEAQKEAFKLTYQAVLTILSDDAKTYLGEALGDLTVYIKNLIETQVNVNRTATPVETATTTTTTTK